MEIQITINAPQLAEAINNLAAAIGKTSFTTCSNNKNISNTAAVPTAPTPSPTNNNVAVPVATNTAPAPIPTNTVPTANIPLAAPPQYSVDQIMTAGAALVDNGKVNDLLNLLHSFGVQAVTDLKPEQLGPFATAMRELGAQI